MKVKPLFFLLTAVLIVRCSDPVDESELELQIIEQTVTVLIADLIDQKPIKPFDGEKIGDYMQRMESDASMSSAGSTFCLSDFLFVLEETKSYSQGVDDELLDFLSSQSISEKRIEIASVIQSDNRITGCDNQSTLDGNMSKISYSRMLFSENHKKARFMILVDYGFATSRFIVKVKNESSAEAKTSQYKWEIEKVMAI